MRIWSINPKYLDQKGLIACWRESLLAKNVLEGKTIGYKNHPQLIRFKKTKNSLLYINSYLYEIYNEAKNRNYNFSKDKIDFLLIKKFTKNLDKNKIPLHDKQLKYEWEHIQKKLKIRDIKKYKENKKVETVEANPIFKIIQGEIESWEIIK